MRRQAGRMMLGLAAVLACGLAPGADTVVVRKRRGAPAEAKTPRHKGIVTRDNAEGVDLTLAGHRGGMKFKRAEVEEVIYDEGRPAEYRMGLNSFNAGRYEVALASFEAAFEQRHHKLLKQYILYYTGRCHQELGQTGEALKAFKGLKSQGTRTRFLTEAFCALVELSLDANEPKPAKKYLDEWERMGGDKGVDRANVLIMKGRIAEKQGRYAEAELHYRGAGEMGGAGTAGQAELGVIRCKFATRRYDEAVRRIRDLVKRPRASATYAEAHVMLGDALKAQAKSPEDWEGALLAYLRVPALYGGDEKTEAKALFEGAHCYRLMNVEESPKRSARLIQMLKSKYPGSKWAKQAE